MRVLVTGCCGFIGSHVSEALLDRGNELRGLDNFDPYYDLRMKRDNLALLGTRRDFDFVEGDIRDGEAVDRLVETFRPHRIVHLAARAGVRPSLVDPLLYEEVNVRGTMHLLEAARRHGVEGFVFASSSSVYGERTEGPFRETDRVDRPVSPYAATKKMGELVASTYHHLYGLPVACLRFFTVYGPRQRPEMAIHKFARLMAKGEPIPLFGKGDSRRDYTYVDDIVEGVLAATESCEGYEIYNLGESHTTTLLELVDLLEKHLGMEARREFQDFQAGDVPVTFADVTHAREKLGYDPRTSMDEGLARFAAWFRETGTRYL